MADNESPMLWNDTPMLTIAFICAAISRGQEEAANGWVHPTDCICEVLVENENERKDATFQFDALYLEALGEAIVDFSRKYWEARNRV